VSAVDLLPPDVLTRREAEARLRVWARRLLVSGLAMGAAFVGLDRLEERHSSEAEKLIARYRQIERKLQHAGSLMEDRERIIAGREAVALLRGNTTAVRLLRVVDETFPPSSRLTSFDLERCPPGEKTEEGVEELDPCYATMTVRGLAPGHKEVGRIIRNMIASKAFSEVALVSSGYIEGPAGPREVEFEILCVLAGEGSSPQSERYGTLEAEAAYE